MGFIFRQPPQSAVTNIFLLPLSRGVWTASALLFLLVGACMAVFCKCFVFMDSSLSEFTVGEVFSFTVGAICQQGKFTVSFVFVSLCICFLEIACLVKVR